MKVLTLVCVSTIFLLGIIGISTNVFGLWIPEPPVKLLEESQLVFVGIITSVNPIEFERTNTFEEVYKNGTSRIKIENYTQTLNQYTVDIKEFVKNPQEFHTITMLEATVGGVPGRSSSIGGFEKGDRVLFFVSRLDGTNQYSPESFKIPENCDATSVIKMPRMQRGDSFSITQEGVGKTNVFAPNKIMRLEYQKDMGTLDGNNFEYEIKIRKKSDSGRFDETFLNEKIQSESQPCHWISTAKMEVIPIIGHYEIWGNIKDNSGIQTFSRSFSVEAPMSTKTQSPLKQFKLGIQSNEIVCNDNLQLIFKYSNISPACVKPESIPKLVERGWAKSE